jgi:hypothetical protein
VLPQPRGQLRQAIADGDVRVDERRVGVAEVRVTDQVRASEREEDGTAADASDVPAV